MQLKLFILPVKNLTDAEAERNAFLRSHRVLAVKKEFVIEDWGTDRIMAGQNHVLNLPTDAKSRAPESARRLVSARS